MGRLKKYLILLVIIVCSVFTFAELPQAPNTLIIDNPDKEVTTVEAPKNREHAEMNITVNKLIPKEIEGYKVDKTEYYIELPEEESLESKEVYFITKSIEDLPDITSVNGKKIIANLKKFENYSIETDEFSYIADNKYIIIDKAPLNIEKFYIAKINRSSGEIRKIYEVNKFIPASVIELEGKTATDNSKIIFQLDSKTLEEIKGKELKIGKTLKDIFNKKTRFARSLNNNILNYELNEREKILSVENRGFDTIRMVAMNGDKIERVYIGNPKEYNGQVFNFKDKPIGYRIKSDFEGNSIKSFHIDGMIKPFHDWNNHYLGHGIKIVIQGNLMYYEKVSDAVYFNGTKKRKWIGWETMYGSTGGVDIYFENNILKNGNNTITLKNPMVGSLTTGPHGRIRVYVESDDSTYPKIGFLNSSDELITTNIKNGQYTLGNVSGTHMPIIGNEIGSGQKEITDFEITVNGIVKKTTVNSSNSGNFNGIVSTQSIDLPGIKVGVDYQETVRSKYGTDIVLSNWDLESKTINIRTRHFWTEVTDPSLGHTADIDIGNYFTINIPEFNSEIYYNKGIAQNAPVIVDYDKKVLEGELKKDSSGNIKIDFNVGTKDYDLGILGTDNGEVNLKIKIPKQVTIKATASSGVESNVVFNTEVSSITSGKKGEDTQYHYIYAPNDGRSQNSSINATVSLKLLSRNREEFTNIVGENLNLISVGADYRGNGKYSTIIDKVNLKLKAEVNLTQEMDITGKNTISSNDFIIIDPTDKINISGEGILVEDIKGEQLLGKGYVIKGMPYIFYSKDKKIVIERLGSEAIIGFNKEIVFEVKSHEGLPIAKFTMQNFIDRVLGEANVTLKNPLIKGEFFSPYGRVRIYPSSLTEHQAKAGYLLDDDTIASATTKNDQFSVASVSGDIVPFIPQDNAGKKITIKMENKSDIEVILASSPNSNPMGTRDISISGLSLGIDYQSDISKTKYGVDFTITSWDLVSKDFWVQIEGETFRNKINFTIPSLDGEVYYNKNLGTVDSKGTLDYTSKKVSNTLEEFLGGELAKFQIGTKDFDLRILGNNSGYNNLRLEIPKTIPVTFISNGIRTSEYLAVQVRRKNTQTKLEEIDNKYIVSLENGIDGVTDDLRPEEDSTMLAEVTIYWDSLKRSRVVDKQDITIEGTNLGLVKIGVPNKMNWTIFDNVEFKIFNKNYNLKFDISEITAPKNNITPSPNEVVEFNIANKIEIYNSKNSLVYSGMGTELENTGWKNDEFGATLKYSNTNQGFIVNKFKNIDYNENFKMLVKAENGVVLRTVNLTLINSDGFEIIDGHGKLDFGDFFPGDIKQAGDTIRFRNIHNAKINVEMKSSTTEMSKLDVSNPAENQKIQVRKLEAYELNTQNKNENHFKIKGEAVTTPTTEVGKYKGTAEVIITIIP